MGTTRALGEIVGLEIQPIQSHVWPASAGVAPTVGGASAPPAGVPQPMALELARHLGERIAEQVQHLGADAASRRAYLERLRAEQLAESIVRKALREEAAIEARIREKLREETAIARPGEGRIRLAYSASEIHEMMQTARRLNISA